MQEYKLKGIDSLTFKDSEKQQFEVEGIEGAKVLLAKVKGKVHALSPNCTHYGAPLVKGVLTGEGRLTCPWHGACFSVETGDIENAPALDPLTKYEVFEKDGAVYICGEESVIKSHGDKLNIKCKAEGNEKVLVVGGGSGTLGAVEGLRGGGYKGHITVISREGYQPIDRTKLSKALLADISKAAWRPMEFYKDASIDIISDEVTKVDVKSKSVSTKSGKTYEYTKLVLAMGGSPRWLPLPGLKGDLGNVFILRALPHAKSIVEAVGDNGKKIVVIGSSFIGLEVANCLVQKGNDVTVVGMEKAPMERVMGEKVGNIFRAILEKNGIKFKLDASVDKGTPSESDPSKIGAVHLKDGTKLPADVVIEGIGVSPATEFLKDNPDFHLEDDQSIRTDEAFRVQGLSDVYAIGDIATYPYHGPGGDGKPVRIEHWNVAQNAGRVVATVIQGRKRAPFVPIFWSALGSQMRYCGNVYHGFDDVVIVGDTQKPAFVGYYTKGETVVAVVSMGKDPYMSQASELMRRNKMPTKSEIQKGVDIMEVELPTEMAM